MTPDQIAARLAEIRPRHDSTLRIAHRIGAAACETCAVLAAYNALVEAVWAWDKLDWPREGVAKAEAAEKMLALARAGRGRTG